MRIAGIEPESIVDGPGIRFTVFTQGCPLQCPGCHNPATWDPDGGQEVGVGQIIEAMASAVLARGLTLSGGEASRQPGDCAQLARAAHEMGWDVWAWSGYTVEALMNQARRNGDLADMLGQIDVVVDGPFQLARRTLALNWRGSSNQRVIDVPATLRVGRAVEWAGSPR
ncbi:anaerobic ribonucleoside-triphosphate reductase activating protein [Cutibacterium sp. WCA-380-WT-3A]|uniref:Anaerobic ribonucleoside-triphosphate reductase-activating protein n=1 Tax=Cutibacterium porci TaxID=2605781 RepID=A0A7K0J8U7_9ACTN|nr:anaerobic ribonucleoside-triphosphate reductase activating protein [Cutibacterium porci]MSS46360.1 anaerobic ribonucleoside-triphosphate reductase activating protein [Cutibacterium porci]